MGQTIYFLLIPVRDKSIQQIFRFLLSPPSYLGACRLTSEGQSCSALHKEMEEIFAYCCSSEGVGKDFFHFFMKCTAALTISPGYLTS